MEEIEDAVADEQESADEAAEGRTTTTINNSFLRRAGHFRVTTQ